jgi:hypothetical protein
MKELIATSLVIVSALVLGGTMSAKSSSAEEGPRGNACVHYSGWCRYCYSPISSLCNCQILPPVYAT